MGPYFFGPGDSHFFQSFNRNKKTMTLDLKQRDGQAVFHDMVKDADGVIDNLRGDLPKKLGITYDQLKAYNPSIVCAHLSAYGRSGSRAAWPGYDYLMQAEAGYLSVTGEPTGPPTRFGVSIVDMMTGVTAVFGLLAGILGARRTGRGMDVDCSLFDVAIHNLSYMGTWYLNEGVVQGKVPRSGHPSLVPSQLFRTCDGWIFIMCNKEKFWVELVQILGRPAWAEDPEFATFEGAAGKPRSGGEDDGRDPDDVDDTGVAGKTVGQGSGFPGLRHRAGTRESICRRAGNDCRAGSSTAKKDSHYFLPRPCLRSGATQKNMSRDGGGYGGNSVQHELRPGAYRSIEGREDYMMEEDTEAMKTGKKTLMSKGMTRLLAGFCVGTKV